MANVILHTDVRLDIEGVDLSKGLTVSGVKDGEPWTIAVVDENGNTTTLEFDGARPKR